MTRKRIIGWIFGSIASLIVVAAAGGFLLLRSRGFHNYVLAGIVDSANQATGGKVEIHDFDFRLSNLTANVYGLVIHGTEPNPDTPLVPAPEGESDCYSLGLYCADADALVHRAEQAGATIREPLTTFVSGDRYASLRDPFGVRWSIMTRVEDLAEEESNRRVEEWAAQQG